MNKSNITPSKILLIHTVMILLMILFRILMTWELRHLHLSWNLFLAWIPLIVALTMQKQSTHFTTPWSFRFVLLFVCWLLFFPNAPYLITDIVHLDKGYDWIMWYDIVLLFSAAFNGLVIGSYSFHKVFKILLNFWSFRTSSVLMIFCVMLGGYGVYLGRILRWNSWDIFTHPVPLLTDTLSMIIDQMAIMMTAVFSSLIIIVYYTFLILVQNERSTK